jgi:hypothetical protein
MKSYAAVLLGLAMSVPTSDAFPEVSEMELARIVERDSIPFTGTNIPPELLEFLAPHKVIILGETHFLREHFEVLAALVQRLHGEGLRQVLLEWPHGVDWLLRDYTQGHGLEPDWEPPPLIGGAMITALRDFNRTLPETDRIQVRAIDVNLVEFEAGLFASSLRSLSRHLRAPEAVEAFLAGYPSGAEGQAKALEAFRDELAGRREVLSVMWGEYWFDTVAEMIEVERVSVGVNSLRNDHYDLSVRLRENAIKVLVDRRLQGRSSRTLINIGANHAQKEFLKGTEQEWLGDYLVHVSTAPGGSVVVFSCGAARGEPGTGGGISDWDVTDASPPNELWRLMNETWPGQTVVLPLDDPVFRDGGVVMNFEGTLYTGAPKRHYDALLQYPMAHHVLSE